MQKSLLLFALVALASCNKPSVKSTAKADSVLVSGSVVGTEVSVKIKLPADRLSRYHSGQRLTCSLDESMSAERYDAVILREDTSGIAVLVRSLDPQ